MPHYRATSPEGVITEYDAVLPDPEHLTAGWRLEAVEDAYVAPEAEPAPPVPQVFDALDFLRRFTPQERIAARQAAKSDPVMEDFYALLEMAEQIHNDDPDVLAGMGYMVMLGIISTERVQEVLHA